MTIVINWFKCDAYDNDFYTKWPQIKAVLILTLTSFNLGTFFGWTSFGISEIATDTTITHISENELFNVATVQSIASCLFAPLLGFVVNKIGRKLTLIVENILFIMSFVILALSKSLLTYYIGAVMGGIASAGVYTAASAYIGEVTEPTIRTSWGNMLSFQISFGQFMIVILGSYLHLRVTLFICAFISFLTIILMLFIPESPYFFLMQNETEKAKKSLKRLRGTDEIDKEFTTLTLFIQQKGAKPNSFKNLFVNAANRRALFLACSLQMFQDFTGVGTVTSYSGSIFKMVNSHFSENSSNITFAGTLLLAYLLVIFCMKNVSRNLTIIMTSIGSGLTITVAAIYFYCNRYLNVNDPNLDWMALGCVFLFGGFYIIGIGTAADNVLSELFCADVKETSLSITRMVDGVSNALTNYIFTCLLNKYGLFASLTFFAICSYLTASFTYFLVPETKGKTLQEIQEVLKNVSNTKSEESINNLK